MLECKEHYADFNETMEKNLDTIRLLKALQEKLMA